MALCHEDLAHLCYTSERTIESQPDEAGYGHTRGTTSVVPTKTRRTHMDEGLVEMFRYNAWANRELFEACRALTDEQLDTHVKETSGPIRELLMHIAGGQQTFILRTQGRQHEGELSRWSIWPGMETVIGT